MLIVLKRAKCLGNEGGKKEERRKEGETEGEGRRKKGRGKRGRGERDEGERRKKSWKRWGREEEKIGKRKRRFQHRLGTKKPHLPPGDFQTLSGPGREPTVPVRPGREHRQSTEVKVKQQPPRKRYVDWRLLPG